MTDIIPYVGAFIASGMLLALPLIFLLPEKLQKYFYHILVTLSILSSIYINLSTFVQKKQSTAEAVKKKKEKPKDKSCLKEKHKKGIFGEDAAFFCYYECIVDTMEFNPDDFYGAQIGCEHYLEEE